MISGSVDEKMRIWDYNKMSISEYISVERPNGKVLIRYQAIGANNLPEFADGNPSK